MTSLDEKQDDLLELFSSSLSTDNAKANSLQVKLILDPTNAAKYFTCFEVGKEKIKLYGNPVVMSVRSKLFKTLLENDDAIKDGTALAPEMEVKPKLLSLINLWIWMNGINTQSYFYNLENMTLTFLSDIWDWFKYFDLDPSNTVFNHFVMTTYNYAMGVHSGNMELETKEFLTDLHEQLEVFAIDDLLREHDGGCDVFSRFDAILGNEKWSIVRENYHKFKNCDWSKFGYLRKTGREKLDQLIEREVKTLEEQKQKNKLAWESLGPKPYPKNYELIWPKFYTGLTWEENVKAINGELDQKELKALKATKKLPVGSNTPGKLNTPPVAYPTALMQREIKKTAPYLLFHSSIIYHIDGPGRGVLPEPLFNPWLDFDGDTNEIILPEFTLQDQAEWHAAVGAN